MRCDVEEATTVWLVRHGLPEGVDGRCYGRHDLRLSPEGSIQASGIANRLASEPISHIYSSTLRRSVETAQVIAEPHGLPVQTVDALAEIHFGDLEGLTYEEIEVRYPDIFRAWMERPTEVTFPNGESFRDMRQRVLDALESVLAISHSQTIAIVTHAGVIRLVIAEVLSIPHPHIFRLAQRHAAVNRLKYFDHGAVVELMNG